MEVEGGFVYWADGRTDQILRGAKDGGGSATVLFDSQPTPFSVDVDDGFVYWVDATLREVRRGAADGSGIVETLFDRRDYPGLPISILPEYLAVDGDFVIWTDHGTDQILRGASDGSGLATVLFDISDYPGSPTTVKPYGVAVHDGFLYWTDRATNQILRGAADGSGSATLLFNRSDWRDPGVQPPLSIAVVHEPVCDFTGDLFCNVADINLMFAQGDLVMGVSVGTGNQFDLNNDSSIDNVDITQWLRLAGANNGYGAGDPNDPNAPYRRGETDDLARESPSTRTVDITDFENFLIGYTGVGFTWEVGNFDGDGDVDMTDFAVHFLPNFQAAGGGSYGPGQSVPEPSAMLLLGLGGMLLLCECWCKRRLKCSCRN